MQSSPKWRMRARLLLLVLGCAGAQWAIPQSAMAQESCNLGTLKGTYIFEYVGFTLINGQHVPFSAAGFDYYNGDGTMTGVFSDSGDSGIIEDQEFTGKYTVNPDCTSEQITNDPIFGKSHYDQFLAPDGEKFTFVQTDEGFVATGIEHRVSPDIPRNSCTESGNEFLPGC
jgi:hypothetical protein